MAKEELPKAYEPKEREERWYRYWIEQGVFTAPEEGDAESFSIVIPPPNVTGSLHMGHALNVTLQDILARWHRMMGYHVLWMPGTDHAGIATQNVVERELAKEGISRHEIGREAFLEKVWEWKEKYGNYIVEQLKRIGASCDWSRLRFTMDEGFSRAVKEVFVRLYQEGLIYRGNYMINWCPRCLTALSDLEVEYSEDEGALYHILYPYPDEDGGIVVATTRPETLLGDTAVAVNPEDPRYKEMVGKTVLLPVLNRPIPIIGDPYVDMEFGTGALKITPAHDPNDFEIGERFGLEVINILNPDGTMNQEAGPYQGMSREECRKRIVKDLEESGLLVKIEPYTHSVGHCYRCATVVEPYLSTQWFVKTKPLAEKAIEAVRKGNTKIVPTMWTKVYYEWMENIRDWCISRQIWWGHRIPAWFCKECGEISVSVEEITRCSHCGSTEIEQESDVLDTWFSSALWPFATMGWPQDTPLLKKYYPTSVLVTGFDILFFWVARMMMMGLHFMGDVPFHDVYIHALVRDEHGQKMSKTRGNVIDPMVMMEKYGTDAFRFTLAALAAQGRDIKMSEARIEGYRHFINKLWNASRFVLMNTQEVDEMINPEKEALNLDQRWLMSRLHATIRDCNKALEGYHFDRYANTLYQFIWHQFCDWGVEFAKIPLYRGSNEEKRQAQAVLLTALESILRLAHPVIPFITEEINQFLPGKRDTLATTAFPTYQEEWIDPEAESEMNTVMEVITALRNIKGELGIALTHRVKAICKGNRQYAELVERNRERILSLAFLEDITVEADAHRPPHSAISVVGEMELYVPLEGVIDLDAEIARIEKNLKKVEKELERVTKKLSNQGFLSKAPKEVIAKEERIKAELIDKRERLKTALSHLAQG